MRLCALLLLLAGCGRTAPYSYRDPLPDAGLPDAGVRDAGQPDAGSDGGMIIDIAGSLDGLRWELPCVKPEPQAPDYVCITTPDVTVAATLTGTPGKRYDIRLRIRGVVETKLYVGGPTDGGHWVVGGTPTNDAWNIYRLSISSPAQTHHLNHGQSGLYLCVPLDYVITVRASAGAKVTLFASAVDGNLSQIRNNVAMPIVVPGVPPAPLAYDGQFIQMDVLGVTEVSP